MSELRHQLEQENIPCRDLDVYLRTDRGDVMFFTTPGGKGVLELWQRLRGMAVRTGFWPVLLGEVEELERRGGVGERIQYPVAETLEAAQKLDFPKWFTQKEEETRKAYLADGLEEDEIFAMEGDWPDEAAPTSGFYTLRKKSPKGVAIAMVPTHTPWEVPAFLSWGGWNECPYPEVQCAAQKYWEHQHGAVIAVATTDVLEMWVERPPSNRDAVLSLAKQHYAFCADIVEQGTTTIANLAASLLGGKTWFFWWD